MTLEEKAEEYANHNDWFEFSANVDKIGNAIRRKMKQAYLSGAEEVKEENKKLKKQIKNLEGQIEKMINEIDKTMVTSNMREREIYDIQEIFRKYDFRRNDNDKWELKE